MSLLSRIFGTKSEATEKASAALASTPEFDRLLAFGCALMRLLNEDRYIARSDYKPIVEEYTDIKTFFLNLQASNLLGMYCEKNGLDEERITYGDGRYATPAWSPDGQFIAFTKIADDTFYIGIMSPNGRNEKILAGGWFMEAPSWAPGSRRIVYYETERALDDIERISHIRSVDITGQNIYDIDLPENVNGVEPTWSPRLM